MLGYGQQPPCAPVALSRNASRGRGALACGEPFSQRSNDLTKHGTGAYPTGRLWNTPQQSSGQRVAPFEAFEVFEASALIDAGPQLHFLNDPHNLHIYKHNPHSRPLDTGRLHGKGYTPALNLQHGPKNQPRNHVKNHPFRGAPPPLQ